MTLRIASATALLLCAFRASADDWPRFRGRGGTGVSRETEAPLVWGAEKNVRWRAPVAGTGSSSPIVSRGRVFVTAAEEQGKKRSLVCLDRMTGAVLWSRAATLAEPEPTQQDNPYCGSTPCADGERVVVWHSSGGLRAYDFDGKELWSRDLGRFTHMWGYGASPVLHGDKVLLNAGPGDRSFVAAFDKRTGEPIWKADEAGGDSKKWIGSWATPVVVKIGGKDQVVVALPSRVKAFDPDSGKVLWTCEGLGKLVYADVAIGEGVAVATGEDEGGDSIGFRLGGTGDVTAAARLWARPRPLEVGTGVVLEGKLWTVDNGGIVRCTEVETGKELLKERAPCGPAWGSPVYAAKRLYVTGRNGDTVVFAPDPKAFAPLAVNRLGEPSNSTPAFSDGEIFIRTSKAVYCIAEKK